VRSLDASHRAGQPLQHGLAVAAGLLEGAHGLGDRDEGVLFPDLAGQADGVALPVAGAAPLPTATPAAAGLA